MSILPVFSNTNFVCFKSRNHQAVFSMFGENDVWLFNNDGCFRDVGGLASSLSTTVILWSSFTSYINHVPSKVGPGLGFSISTEPLLLSTWINFTINLNVRHVSTTGISIALSEIQITIYFNSSEG